ncbi:MAG: zinc ribbon domain-containing protein, partial [Bacillus sp. (in: Bacteria)]|nr:zinc ribbon domain-containing protein [Bacillus sp. (in: firmicutes)]
MYCSQCGGVNGEKNLYCLYCGQDLKNYPVPAVRRQEGQSKIFCRYCGKPNEPNHIYCQYCGQSMETIGATSKISGNLGLEVKSIGRGVVNLSKGIRGLGKDSWLDASAGAIIAVLTGIIMSFLGLKIISLILVSMAGHDRQTTLIIKECGKLFSPMATWIFTHLPGQYLSVGGSIPDMQMKLGANSYFHLPMVTLLLVPIVGLYIGSLMANRKFDKKDWLGRSGQGFRMGLIYAVILFILSLFTGGEINIPVPLKNLIDKNLFNVGLHIGAGFQRLNLLVNGLVIGTVFGIIVSVRSHLFLVVQNYAGERGASVFLGIWRALLISFTGGLVFAVVGILVFLSKKGMPHYTEEWLIFAACILFLPNLIIYGLSLGGGASLHLYGLVPGEKLPNLSISLLSGIIENGRKLHNETQWVLYILFLLVLFSLFWGGYQAQRRSQENVFINGLMVAGGYSFVLSMLAWTSQLKAVVDLGRLRSFMSMMGMG